jgi:siroheme synthase-like protein
MPAVRFGYPLMLDLSRRRVLIVGGGTVAVRKARGLIDAGCAHVCVVAPRIAAAMPPAVRRIERQFQTEDLDRVDVAFAATDDPAVNDQVIAEARSRNILVNLAGSPGSAVGDFTVPARHRRGPVTISVAAGSPALAALIRDRLAKRLDPAWAQLATAISAIRSELRRQGVAQPQRRRIMRRLASDEALAVLRARGPNGLRQWLSAETDATPDTTATSINPLPQPAAK